MSRTKIPARKCPQLPPGARHGRHDRTVSWVAARFWSVMTVTAVTAMGWGGCEVQAVKKVDNL